MGCANSKQKRCRNCNAPYSPVPRSYSMHVHHPAQDERDSYHVVALTSTTLGTLKLNSPALNGKVSDSESFRFPSGEDLIHEEEDKKKEEFSMGLIEAKTWSNMIDQKLPKVVPMTPTRTPPGEPETIINTWELMEGLEDTTSPFRSPPPSRFRSFSFDVNGGGESDAHRLDFIDSPKPLWLHMTEKEARLGPAVSDFDPEVISSFRKSLMQLSPDSPFHLKPAPAPAPSPCDEEKQGTKNGLSLFDEKKTKGDNVGVDDAVSCGKEKLVFYSTSLRGVRKTYEDCCQVRLILKGLGVRTDERDVSMHSGFKEELRELLGNNYGNGGRGGLLPKVFVGRNCIGGAEEIQRLHEDGKLEKILDGCEKIEESNDFGGVCEACGDIRFVPCETCYGSCKIYYEVDDEEEEEGEKVDCDDGEYGFQRCPDCNENGLIRCPICCY